MKWITPHFETMLLFERTKCTGVSKRSIVLEDISFVTEWAVFKRGQRSENEPFRNKSSHFEMTIRFDPHRRFEKEIVVEGILTS